MNKYAEGYPEKKSVERFKIMFPDYIHTGNIGRYYGGCDCVDMLELYTRYLFQRLFNTDYHVNVQPHSGSQANEAAYAAFIKPGDTILSMSLSNGGHLSHGLPANFSGKLYKIVEYGVDENGFIDYDDIRQKIKEFHPNLVLAGASAYPRIIDFERIRNIIDEECGDENPFFMVDMAHIAGLVAAGVHPSPVPYADITTTTTHKTLRGPRGGLILTNDEELAKKINKAVFPGTQGGPLMHVIAAKAVCFGEALKPEFQTYGKTVVANASALADGLMQRGFRLVSGGTDNHLMLVDLRPFGDLTGKEFERRLDEVFITVNKNAIPNDPQKPFVTSGIRVGTPAVTTRGLQPADMEIIAQAMYLAASDFENKAEEVRESVCELCKKYPLYE